MSPIPLSARIAAVSFVVVSCGPPPEPFHLSRGRAPNPNAIWQFHDLKLEPNDGVALDENKVWAVIRYDDNSPSRALLAHDDRVTSFHSEAGQNFALVGLENQAQLDVLAEKAHQGGSCGLVQRLNLAQKITALQAFHLPVYNARVPLAELSAATKQVNVQNIVTSMTTLSALKSRHHTSDTSAQATSTVKSLFETAGAGLSSLSVDFIPHKNTAQNSVIASLAGSSEDDVVVIVGAHLDSISTPGALAPGADDDASGVATLVEVLRVIAANKLTFKRRIEFQAYAAEEVGLVGSREIAQSYAAEKRKVAAMFQIDMNAYSAKPKDMTIHLAYNNTTTELRRALKSIIHNYTDTHYQEGYLPEWGSSDHQSWFDAGFNTVFPFEDVKHYNPLVHSANDTIQNANNPDLAGKFSQLSLAFLGHYAGLTKAESTYSSARPKILPQSALGKIQLAITKDATDSSLFNLTAAVPKEAVSVEFCRINSGTEDDCSTERQTTTADSNQTGTHLYFSSTRSHALAKGQKWRFEVFAADDKLLAYRQVQLK